MAITRHACIILCWGDESVAITRHACIILCWGDGECGYYTSCMHNTVLGRRRVWLLHVMHAYCAGETESVAITYHACIIQIAT